MYVTWQGIIAGFLAVCAGFTCICVAVGWLVKIIKAIRKPGETVNKKLENDNERLKKLEDDYDYIKKSVGLLMQCDLVVLGHLRTHNETGRIVEMEEKLNTFLTTR